MDCTDPSKKDDEGDENGSINGVTERFRARSTLKSDQNRGFIYLFLVRSVWDCT